MMANNFVFTDEEMTVDEGLGYPKAYSKLCAGRSFGPFSHGPPFTFTPYGLVAHREDSRAKELDEMFPIINPKAKPTKKPNIFLSLLWKQLNHLGNAGFDPDIIRVDSYGNVVYYHADAASPLAWDIDHWFPCSRGGLSVPSNLRIMQWQACKRKHNKLEFLVPWWDFQLGISINQFLSIFASSNSDFRRRAFSWLFSKGESEELNASQTVESHIFPQHYLELKGKLGLAPAAVVLSRRESFDSPLKSQDLNRRPSQIQAVKKLKQYPNENINAIMATDPYQAIVMARDSLKQRQVTIKMNAEIQKLDNEVCQLQQRTEEEKVSTQELELVLMNKRRRAEKYRRLAESQCSYRAMLEKMIRDAMHQSVVYKEQVRLNQAAASALLARLEAQKAICDSAERELHRKYKQRDELEKQMRPGRTEQARKRSRMEDNNTLIEETESKTQHEMEMNDGNKNILYMSKHKELRKFLEEEQSPSEPTRLEGHDEKETNKSFRTMKPDADKKFMSPHEPEEDDESRCERGKGNIEKWLRFLLEEDDPESTDENRTTRNDDLPHKEEIRHSKGQDGLITLTVGKERGDRRMSSADARKERVGKEREFLRSESGRGFLRIPSSPSVMLEGMKKRVDCIRKKPSVLDDDDDDITARNSLKRI